MTHIGFQHIQYINQISCQHHRKDSANERPQTAASRRFQRFGCLLVSIFHIFITHTGHDRCRIYAQGQCPCQRSQADEKGAQKCQDQSRDSTDEMDDCLERNTQPGMRIEIGTGKGAPHQSQHSSDACTGQGHLHRGPKWCQYDPTIGHIRRYHGSGNIEETHTLPQ